MDQGETLLKALQDAVPEDVREKLTGAVTGILQTPGTRLKFDGLLDVAWTPDVSSGLKSEIEEKVGESSSGGFDVDHHYSYGIKKADEVVDSSNIQPATDKPNREPELDLSPEKSQKTVNLGQSQSMSGDGVDTSGSAQKDHSEPGNNENHDEFSQEKSVPCLDYGERGLEAGVKPNSPSPVSEHKDQGSGIETKEENNNHKTEEKTVASSTDENNLVSASTTEEVSPGSSSEAQVMESEGNDNQKKDDKVMQPIQDQTKSIMGDPSGTFGVSQALDAFAGMDDSTQVAVNSVFGVLENMLAQMEDGLDEENRVEDGDVKEKKTESVTEKNSGIDNHQLEKKEENESERGMQHPLTHHAVDNDSENSLHPQHDPMVGTVEEETIADLNSSSGKSMVGSQGIKANIHVIENKNGKADKFFGSELIADNSGKLRHVGDIPLYIKANPHEASFHNSYVRKCLMSKKHAKSLDVDSTTALLLDYFPEEGQWKLLEQPGNIGISAGNVVVESQVEGDSPAKSNDTDNFIEPSYVIFDTEKVQEPVTKYETRVHRDGKVEISDEQLEELMCFVKNIVMDSLKVEVGRRLSAPDMKKLKPRLARDLELVANAVSLAIGHEKEYIWFVEGKRGSMFYNSKKLGTLHGENIIRAISSAVRDTNYLRRVLPIGVIVGSSLAALRKSFNVTTVNDNRQREVLSHLQANRSGGKSHCKFSVAEPDEKPFNKSDHDSSLYNSVSGEGEKDVSKISNSNAVMVGAVTAALGASALLVNQQVKVSLLMLSYYCSLALQKTMKVWLYELDIFPMVIRELLLELL